METALSRVQHDIAGILDTNCGAMLAMIDLLVPFDAVDHGKLPTLLQDDYDVSGVTHDGFAYLSHRHIN